MTYIVLSGDSLFTIAQKFNTTLSALISANPQIADPNMIYPGQTILIPSGTESCPLLRQGDRGPAVQRFQLLLTFARYNPGPIDGIFGPKTQATLLAFQRNTKELDVTGVVDAETWVALDGECESRPEVTTYIVRPGDSLFIIATRFNISVDSILRINPKITNPNVIFKGQVIDIPKS